MSGKTHYLWRAVDQEGEVLESYLTKKRDRKAALRLMKKALRTTDLPTPSPPMARYPARPL